MTNPSIYRSRLPPYLYSISFKTKRKTTCPLWWTEQGFKDLGIVCLQPEEFETEKEAESKLKSEILNHIRRWRADEASLIVGWD